MFQNWIYKITEKGCVLSKVVVYYPAIRGVDDFFGFGWKQRRHISLAF